MNKSMLDIYHQLLMPPRACMNPKRPEDQICVKLANALRGWTVENKLNAVWFPVFQEVTYTSHEKKIGPDGKPTFIRKFSHKDNLIKAMGKYPGVSDYIFGNGEGMYCLEMKTKTGVLTDNQKAFRSWCELKGAKYVVAKSFEEAEAQLREWGILK
jgi:hypothetical protein